MKRDRSIIEELVLKPVVKKEIMDKNLRTNIMFILS